jgi:hypothetical protein
MAISDLTSAIWVKDGLSPAEKQDAIGQRQAAYQAAGISNAPDLGAEAYATSSPSPSPSAPAAGGGSWQTAMSGDSAGAAATPPSATPAVPSAAPSAAAAAPSAAPAAPPPVASGSSGGIGGFFNSITGGIFSSSSSSSPASPPAESAKPPEPVTTASYTGNETAKGPEVSSWSQTTEVASDPAPPVRTVAAVHEAASPAPPPQASARKGKYVLQVAAVRSREEADLMVARLLTQHGGELGGRDPAVDEAVIGSMGTFYRVRVGPYADASEPKRLCSSLQSGGFDCLVVTK